MEFPKTLHVYLPDGNVLDIMNPDPKLIRKEDIIMSICRQPRYNGLSKYKYSVGAHSSLAAYMAKKHRKNILIQIAVFTHDFAEGYMGDIINPIKHYFREFFDPIEANLLHHIRVKLFGEEITKDVEAQEEQVKYYDNHIFEYERDAFFASPKDYFLDTISIERFGYPIKQLEDEEVQEALLVELEQLIEKVNNLIKN